MLHVVSVALPHDALSRADFVLTEADLKYYTGMVPVNDAGKLERRQFVVGDFEAAVLVCNQSSAVFGVRGRRGVEVVGLLVTGRLKAYDDRACISFVRGFACRLPVHPLEIENRPLLFRVLHGRSPEVDEMLRILNGLAAAAVHVLQQK